MVQYGFNLPLGLLIDEYRCRVGMGPAGKSYIVIRVEWLDHRIVKNSLLAPVHSRVHFDCIILCVVVILENCKEALPAGL